jgi:Transcription factor WhiB
VRTCRVCGETKPLDQFRTYKVVYHAYVCRSCMVEQNRARRKSRALATAEKRQERKAKVPPSRLVFLDLSRHDLSGGSCVSIGGDAFYPEPTEPGYREQVKMAKRVCNECPVQKECLEAGLEQDATWRWGIWGGLTGSERARLTTERNRRKGND